LNVEKGNPRRTYGAKRGGGKEERESCRGGNGGGSANQGGGDRGALSAPPKGHLTYYDGPREKSATQTELGKRALLNL